MSEALFNDEDLLRLEQLLVPLASKGSTMRPDEVQGFFAALICGPDLLDADFWLPHILGDAPAFANEADYQALLQLLHKLYADTSTTLAQGGELGLLLYAEDGENNVDYWPWANAFLYALETVPTDWFEASAEDEEAFENLMMPMLVLGGAFEEEDGEDLLTFSDAEIEDYQAELNDALIAVHQYWRNKPPPPITVH